MREHLSEVKTVSFSVCLTVVLLYYFIVSMHRVTWSKSPPFGDDLSLTYLFASTSEKSYMYVTNDMLCIF